MINTCLFCCRASVIYGIRSGKSDGNATMTDSHSIKWQDNRFGKFFARISLGLLILVALFNFLIDPYDLYGTTLFEPLQFNRYERKIELFSNFSPPPEVLILGSSRSETIDPDYVTTLTGKPCFNWGLTGGEPGSMLAALSMAVYDFEAPIDTVIIGIDPSTFNPHFEINSQGRLVHQYTQYFLDEPSWIPFFIKLGRLLTIGQVKAGCYTIFREIGLLEGREDKGYDPDGKALYLDKDRLIESGRFNLEHEVSVQGPEFLQVRGFDRFDSPSDERKIYWEKLLQVCGENNITVYVFIPPMHPDLWDLIIEAGGDATYNEIVDYIKNSVRDSGGTYKNFTFPASFGADPDLFYDSVHMRRENSERLVSSLLAQPRNYNLSADAPRQVSR